MGSPFARPLIPASPALWAAVGPCGSCGAPVPPVGLDWVTLTIRCRLQQPLSGEAGGTDVLFAYRTGPNGMVQHRTVTVDFVHGRVDLTGLRDFNVGSMPGLHARL
jgi:hypothetical protein